MKLFHLLAAAAVAAGSVSHAQEWRPVPAGGKFNVSGMALLGQEGEQSSFLIVQDNKRPEEDRAGVVTVKGSASPTYASLAWPAGAEMPVDLESVTRVPGSEHDFLTLDSSGKVYRLRVEPNGTSYTLEVNGTFELPQVVQNANYEGFALQRLDGKLLAVWGHRGKDVDPGVIAWGVLDLESGKFAQVKSTTFNSPWPTTAEVRHLSDLKVDSAGVVYVTAASDPGNFGPFQSAAYVAGAFAAEGEGFQFRKSEAPVRVQTSRFNKAEALELVPGVSGGIVLGSDDESVGGAVWVGW